MEFTSPWIVLMSIDLDGGNVRLDRTQIVQYCKQVGHHQNVEHNPTTFSDSPQADTCCMTTENLRTPNRLREMWVRI